MNQIPKNSNFLNDDLAKKTIEILINLIKINTIKTCDEAFLWIKKNIPFKSEIVGDDDKFMLIFIPPKNYEEFNENAKTICFCGHLDVVPVSNDWDYDPFSAKLVDKSNNLAKEDDISKGDFYVFGRGTQDMKSGVAAILAALKKRDNINQIVLLISDEEEDSKSTQKALKYMKQNALLPDFALVCEPTCEKFMGDSIKTARRGSVHFTLDIFGLAGHVAYPQKCTNAVDLLALVLEKLSGYIFDEPKSVFEPSKIVINSLTTNTHISNVVPSCVSLRANVRNTTFVSLQDIKKYVEHVLLKAGFSDKNSENKNGLSENKSFDLKLWQTSKPFLSTKNDFLDILSKSVEKITKIMPNHNAKGGTSDARFFAEYGVDVCEFGVINDLIHQKNEKVEFAQVLNLARVIVDFMDEIESCE